MLIIRFNKNDEIIDKEVTFKNVRREYKKLKRKYRYVEIILIENGVEHFVWS